MKVIIDGIRYIPAPKPAQGRGLDDALKVMVSGGTVLDYLRELLELLWQEQDGFSGKRPFGNSGWEWDLYVPLAKAGFIDLGPVSEDGCFDSYNGNQKKAAHEYVKQLILRAFERP